MSAAVRKSESDTSMKSSGAETEFAYAGDGLCPICETTVSFTARHSWYRDHLLCSSCGSIPRERALALMLDRLLPRWRSMTIHESSPGNRGISPKLHQQCPGYIASQYFSDKQPGSRVGRFQNENLERQTFPDETFDLVVTLDVMEHVNEPELVFKEVNRTLKPGGYYIFTVPTYKNRVESERRSRYLPDGKIEHFAEPEYHGNPISDAGSLVTFHYGYDLAEMIHDWSGMNVEVTRFHDHEHGIIGEFTEVYVAKKSAKPVAQR
jgi:SAM-dependent methyltransferase